MIIYNTVKDERGFSNIKKLNTALFFQYISMCPVDHHDYHTFLP